ncbi:DNA topoisomerase 2-beta-like protein [Leptotrombidium deliense]|uniref:DNA topoisomerase 2 n=1 Tax=Leptotrombidium deliense TaxID=299467 RepID=A0A443SVK6_9ACAR|nr:DNA topoisomerase 2-beta-like protein [Leptotrombidium deliense]
MGLDDSDLSYTDDEDIVEVSNNAKGGNTKRLSVERIYQKKTPLEHILLRPDTYIGSVEHETQEMWVYDTTEEAMVFKKISFVPGLYKIFDEILVNAADNKQRDPKMDTIKIEINPAENKISIYNNGKGIPVVEHKDEKMYVPSLIFGHLLTSSNYNDEEKKVTGGRNGYGAKLCNIFATKFVVETSSKEYRKFFKQTWTNNMKNKVDAKITTATGDDYTKITFYPDLPKFKMESLDDDIVALMTRRAYDIAGTSKGVKVFLNGKKLPIKGFKDYVDLYLKGKEDEAGNSLKIAYEDVNQRWEIAASLSDKGFNQVSFVNSIATTKGGRHVDHVADQITAKLIEVVKKKNKDGVNIKPFQVKNNLFVFVNCLIENPTFDSQTKETMTLQPKSFGSKCQPSDKFFQACMKIGVVEATLTWVRFKAESQLDKKCNKSKQSKLKNIPKLDDANDAGKKNSIDCTLILTEGDSAKSLVIAGLGVVGRDRYGVFPLRGKMLNVREATHKQIFENAEINNLIKILGLQYKKKYTSMDDLKTLRYGRLMIMTDQDQDGSHIKGLLINFIHHNWPELLQLPFLEEFITPIVKVSKGNQKLSFFSLPEFDEWKRATTNWSKWKVKYYKGLGTSTNEEAKEYFNDLSRHRIKFKYQGPEDDHSLLLAFSKKMVDQRKDWLTNSMEDRKRRRELGLSEVYLYGKDTKIVTYKDFVNKELVLFSNLDNERSIPSVMDGLKPGQRKVMFTCFKRNDKREVKVAQLAGAVGEKSAYHHGEASLMATIINLAQNYVGSNNINLLQPLGQFGTRLQGGKDAASPRYIFTMLSSLAKKLFVSLDEPLYNYLFDDNLKIEPEYYVPIIPMVLVNGADGIGTGWSTRIPNYNPREIVENIKRLLRNDDLIAMKPWFKGFRGSIVQVDTQKFVVNGVVSVLDNNSIEITELPVRTWTQSYKENVLEPMLNGTDKCPAVITDYREYHTDETVKFILTMSEATLAKAEEQGLHKFFKLQTSLSATTMVAFDHNGCIHHYESPEEILREFYDVRLDFYHKRKDYLVGMLEAETLKLMNQARFILEKIEGKLKIENVKKAEFVRVLIDRQYDSDPVKAWQKKNSFSDEETAQTNEDENESNSDSEDKNNDYDYDYLLDMKMRSMLREKVIQLNKLRDEKKEELEKLRRTTPASLWESDLQAFLEELDKVEADETDRSKVFNVGGAKVGKGKGKGKKASIDTQPSLYGRLVEPSIDFEQYKKKEAGDGTRKRSRKVKDASNNDVICEDEDKPLAERVGNSPALVEEKRKTKTAASKLKQTTLNFKPVAKSDEQPKKQTKSSNNGKAKKVKEVKTKERKAVGKKGKDKKNPWSDSEEDSDVVDLSDNAESDVSDDFLFSKTKEPEIQAKRTSEELFDDIFNGKKADDQENEEVEKPSPKKPVKKPTTKKKVFSDSESDVPVSKKPKTKKTKSNFSSSSDDEDVQPLKERIESRARSGRNVKSVKYVESSDEMSDE